MSRYSSTKAQLIRVSDDTHLWSETYDLELKDVLAIQEEISNAIVDKLKVQLLGEEHRALIRPYTANMEARNWYFRGRSFSQRGDVGGPERAIEFFEKAIEEMERALELDPLSGPARSWLGMILIQAHRFDQALETLQETLELGPPSLIVRPWIARIYVEKGLYDMAVSMIQGLAPGKRAYCEGVTV